MLKFLFIFFYLCISFIFAFDYSTCKFFISNVKNKDFGINNKKLINNFALDCTNNENQIQSNNLNEINNQLNCENKNIDEIKEKLSNMCCGEVNEKFEIEEYENLEKELLVLLQKIRKNNIKKIYEKSKQFYKFINKKE